MAEKTIVCPHCNQELSIDEQYLGMEVECPTCNQSFTAQAASSVKNTFQQIKNASAQLGNSVVQFDAIKNTFQQIKNVAAARQEEQEEEELTEKEEKMDGGRKWGADFNGGKYLVFARKFVFLKLFRKN